MTRWSTGAAVEDYYEFLATLHDRVRPLTYVELSVQHGKSLALAGSETLVLGIDPDLRITVPLWTGNNLYQCTSDVFFERYDLQAELENRPVGLAFIDPSPLRVRPACFRPSRTVLVSSHARPDPRHGASDTRGSPA